MDLARDDFFSLKCFFSQASASSLHLNHSGGKPEKIQLCLLKACSMVLSLPQCWCAQVTPVV